MDLITRRRSMMAQAQSGVLATATGNPMTFVTDMVRRLNSLVIPFTPIQTGTGDPSPTNIRPITGLTGCEISHSGADTSNPNVITLSWQTEAGTVYGGALTVNEGGSGTLVVDRAKLILDGTQSEIVVNWRPKTNSVGFYYNFTDIGIANPASAYTVTTAISDTLKAVSYNEIFDNDISSLAVLYSPGYQRIFCRITDPTLTTKTATNAYLAQNPIEIVYELVEPITYNLTALQVLQTLNGTNTIWIDTNGTNTATYWTH